MRAGPAGTLLACATALFGVLGGCAQQALDPVAVDPSSQGAHRIFVLGHGFHTGLAVRAREVPEAAWPARRDFPDADYLELGWGDREYYPRAHPGVWLALRALFTPTSSTLHVVPIAGPLTRFFRDSEIIELQVSQAGFERMVEFVRQTYELDANGRAIAISSEVQDGSRFYASPRTFHAFENCNVWVARALEAAGLPVHPETAITAGMLLRQVRRLRVAAPAAYTVRSIPQAAPDARDRPIYVGKTSSTDFGRISSSGRPGKPPLATLSVLRRST